MAMFNRHSYFLRLAMFNRHLFVFALLIAVIVVPAFLFESGMFSRPDAHQPDIASDLSGQTTFQQDISLNPSDFATGSPSVARRDSFEGSYPQPSPVPVQLTSSPAGHESSPPAAPIRLLPFSAGTHLGGVSNKNEIPSQFVPAPQLSEIFRFDLTPQWVKSRWDRVSITSTDYGLKAMRVALVTGTNANDLHGALTYYFDKQQQLQRITLRGWSGDASRLVQLVTSGYGFKAQNTHMSGLYLAKPFLNITGALLMQDAAVVHSKNPTQQVAISMEINNPDGTYILSPEFATMLPR